MSVIDHERLAKLLRGCPGAWLLSYDDCEEVRLLYSWAKIESFDVNYSIEAGKKGKELLIQRQR